jgi:hypothetical protein
MPRVAWVVRVAWAALALEAALRLEAAPAQMPTAAGRVQTAADQERLVAVLPQPVVTKVVAPKDPPMAAVPTGG